MKHKLSLNQRILKLERLMQNEDEDVMRNYNDVDDTDEKQYTAKYIVCAQRVYDIMEEVTARLESVPSDMEVLHLNTELLDQIKDLIEQIKDDCTDWLENIK